jgi:hypothetical protein
LNFIICLFVFYEFIPISWVRFSRLIRVDLGYYVCTFFFNLRLQNWVDWELRFIIFLFIYFLWGYHGLMTWVMGWLIDSRCFCHFLVDFFSISFFNIGFTGIRLHNLFWFDLYEDILVFWSRSQVWLIESSGLIFLKKNYPSILGWLRIDLYNLFWFSLYGVISVSWHMFDMLNQVDLTYYFSWILFSI